MWRGGVLLLLLLWAVAVVLVGDLVGMAHAATGMGASSPYAGRPSESGEAWAAGVGKAVEWTTEVEKFVLGHGAVSYTVDAVKPTATTPGGWVATAHGAREAVSLALPDGRCFNRQWVSATAANYSCSVATNAGFFNVSDGGCEGIVVVDGHVMQTWSTRRASVGKLAGDGGFVAGDVGPHDVETMGFRWLGAGAGRAGAPPPPPF